MLAALLLLSRCEAEPQQTVPATQATLPVSAPAEIVEDGCTRAAAGWVHTFPDNRPAFSREGSFYSTDILVELAYGALSSQNVLTKVDAILEARADEQASTMSTWKTSASRATATSGPCRSICRTTWR